MITQQRHRASPDNAKLLASSGPVSFLYLPLACFYEVHMEMLPAPALSEGSEPRLFWPLCLFSAALIHQCLPPAGQQVCDLVTRLFVAGV